MTMASWACGMSSEIRSLISNSIIATPNSVEYLQPGDCTYPVFVKSQYDDTPISLFCMSAYVYAPVRLSLTSILVKYNIVFHLFHLSHTTC